MPQPHAATRTPAVRTMSTFRRYAGARGRGKHGCWRDCGNYTVRAVQTLADAAGDPIVASANDTFAKKSLGTDNHVCLRWTRPPGAAKVRGRSDGKPADGYGDGGEGAASQPHIHRHPAAPTAAVDTNTTQVATRRSSSGRYAKIATEGLGHADSHGRRIGQKDRPIYRRRTMTGSSIARWHPIPRSRCQLLRPRRAKRVRYHNLVWRHQFVLTAPDRKMVAGLRRRHRPAWPFADRVGRC